MDRLAGLRRQQMRRDADTTAAPAPTQAPAPAQAPSTQAPGPQQGSYLRVPRASTVTASTTATTATTATVEAQEQVSERPVASMRSFINMERQLESLNRQVAELTRIMMLSFDTQVDIQRSIRQEVAAAMAQPETTYRPPGKSLFAAVCVCVCTIMMTKIIIIIFFFAFSSQLRDLLHRATAWSAWTSRPTLCFTAAATCACVPSAHRI